MIAGFFAGIGGALAAINFEIVNASDSLSAARSGGYLLFTFLGGATFFFGPIIGAVLLVLASVLLSEVTKAWLLYLGLIFLFMVMYAPGGIASLIMMNLRVAAYRKLTALWGWYAALAATALVMLVGLAALIELIYHLQLESAHGLELRFLGLTLDTRRSRAGSARWPSPPSAWRCSTGAAPLRRRVGTGPGGDRGAMIKERRADGRRGPRSHERSAAERSSARVA